MRRSRADGGKRRCRPRRRAIPWPGATPSGGVRALAARDLSPVGAWPLEARLWGRPVGLGDGGLVSDRAGGVMAFGRDGQRIWSIKLGAEVVGSPQVLGRSILFLTADG